MTVHLVTGHAGSVHVTAAEQGQLNAHLWGDGVYILSGCECSITDNNTVHIGEGTLLIQGRHVNINDGGDDVSISTGTVGKYRRDMVCIEYAMDSLTGIETAKLKVVEGTPGDDYTTPVLDAESILDGDNPCTVGLYTVDVDNGLVLKNVMQVVDNFQTYAGMMPALEEQFESFKRELDPTEYAKKSELEKAGTVVETVGSGSEVLGYFSDSACKNIVATVSDVCSCIENHRIYKKLFTIPDFAKATDAELLEFINSGVDLTQYWEVGQTRTINLGAMSSSGVGESQAAQTATIVLMHANPSWIKTADGKTPSFVWGLKNGLKTYGYMNSSNTNDGGWNNCARRTWCNSTFRNALPAWLKSSTKQVKIVTANGSSTSTATSSDYCWLPAEKEVFGSNTYANSTAESSLRQLEWYKTSANRIKKQGDSGSADVWWERSPYSGGSSYFCAVGSSGSANFGGASYTCLLSPCGCF